MEKSLQELRIIFMGTPDFGAASLHKLVENGLQIVAVITAPDRAAGRGMEVQQSAVKKYALTHGLLVLQPGKLKDPDFIMQLRGLKADLQVVVAFRMLPELVWNMPPMGTLNVHGSLLPQYRGAAPINWAIIRGEKVTGVTTFKLKHEIDTGDILLQQEIPIGDNETAGELHDRMKDAGADLLLKTLEGLASSTLTEVPQAVAGTVSHAPKLFTATGEIDWSKPVEEVHNLIRGLSPNPCAYTYLDGKTLKIYNALKLAEPVTHPPGVLFTDNKNFMRFACNDGYMDILTLQLQGKKQMAVTDFLRGYRFK